MSASVTIRRIEPSDYEAIQRIFTGPRVVWGTLQLPYPSLALWQKRLQSHSENWHDLAACIGDEIVGHAMLQSFSEPRRNHAGAIGMTVRDDMQGKGIGTALMGALVDMADNWYNFHRLELEVYPDNEPAVRLYRRFGFAVEGTLKDYAFRDGQYVDALAMARIREGASAEQQSQHPAPAVPDATRRAGKPAPITIRMLEASDYAALHRIQTSPNVVRMTTQLPYQTVESYQKLLLNRKEGTYDLAACVGEDIVGRVTLFTHPMRARRKHIADIGITVRDDMQGKGVGTALMQAAIDMADQWLNLRRLELTVDADNEPALRLYRNFGFEVEARMRDYVFRAGRYVDAVAMARLRR